MIHSRLAWAVGVLLLLWGSTPIVHPPLRTGPRERELARRRRAARFGPHWPLGAVLAGGTLVVLALGPAVGAMLVAGALAGAAAPPARRWLWRLRLRRRAELALLAAMELAAPAVRQVERSPVGESIHVQVATGSDVAAVEARLPAIAAALRAREVRLRSDPADAALAELVVVRVDPLARGCRPLHLLGEPGAKATGGRPPGSLHEPIEIGVGEGGEPAVVTLVGHHLLVGGEPGSGKSVWLFDGKLVELDLWRRVATRFVGPDLCEANDALDELRGEMEHRYERLRGKARKVARGDGERIVLVLVDELAFYVAGADKKAAQRFAELLRDLVARARAAGIVVVAATQKPSTDLVPSALRDLFSFRLAHRCATRDASDTILGAGAASAGFSAAGVDPALRGVGYLLADGGVPRRIRSYHLDDEDVAAIVERAARVREGTA
jgi:DNA segregation ATPase FtsK/SpoIIIE-like protein